MLLPVLCLLFAWDAGRVAVVGRLFPAAWRAMVGNAAAEPAFAGLEKARETACGSMPLGNAAYCGKDHTIYYDPRFLDQLRQSMGEYAPIVVLAHEWGHAIFAKLPAKRASGYAEERMADCLAGAITRGAIGTGLAARADLEVAEKTLMAVGEPHGKQTGSHPSWQTRRDAFRSGFQRGVDACTAVALEKLKSE
jgi:predicted metalloprotease